MKSFAIKVEKKTEKSNTSIKLMYSITRITLINSWNVASETNYFQTILLRFDCVRGTYPTSTIYLKLFYIYSVDVTGGNFGWSFTFLYKPKKKN